MHIKQVLSGILGVSVAMLAAGIISGLPGAGAMASTWSWTTAATWMFQGRVYEGDEGTEPPDSQSLAGVIVSAHGSDNAFDPGILLDSTTTDGTGWYGLTVPDGYEYYHIREANPSGYTSVGARSVDGTAVTGNWIQYMVPLDGKTLTGNKFWDQPGVTLFEDDFEDGEADGWELGEGWAVTGVPRVAYVLSGSAPYWAAPVVDGWSDYELTARIRLHAGTVHVNFRLFQEIVDDTTWIQKRYILGLSENPRLPENRLYVKKQVGSDFVDLHAVDIPFSLGEWHAVRIHVEGTAIQVYVDAELVADLIDVEDPLLFGRFAFELLEGSQVDVDDVVVIGPPPAASPPGYVWYRTGGPSGGLGYDIRIHPTSHNTLFVTDNPSGVNKSYDGGISWVQRNQNITARTGPTLDEIPIFSLTIDPSHPNIVWVGTQNKKGIYRSIDAGETWQKRDSGVTEGDEISFRGFGVHPTNSDIVLGGAEIRTGILGKAFDKTKGIIYKTTDGGQNWYPVWVGDNLVRFVLFDHADPDIMYASTGIFDREAWDDQPDQGVGVGVLKSENGGEGWFPINNGIPDSEGNRFVGYLEMHPANPDVLFAASGNNTWGNGGVFRTTDGGLNWTKVLSDDIFTLVTFSPSHPNVVYAGSGFAIYRSDDGGDHWQQFNKPAENNWGPPGIRAGVPIGAAVAPDDPMTIFVNNYQGGNFKSTDGGQTWVDASRGYTGAKLTDIAIHPNSPAIVYTIGRSGPFRSINAGSDWTGLAYSPASFPEWYAVTMNPDNPQEILISDGHTGSILKSTNGGQSWVKVFDHPIAGYTCPLEPRAQKCFDGFRAIAFAPSNSSVVYAGMSADRRVIDTLFPARASYGMYKSTNGGATGTWQAINTGLPTSSSALLNIHAIAVHPTNPNVAYVGTWKNGVFKTTDGGQHWVAKSSGLTSMDVRSLAIDPGNPQVVYAGLGEGKGVCKSTNGGDLWGTVNAGLSIECPSSLMSIGQVEQGMSLERPSSVPLNLSYSSIPWTSIWDIAIDPTNSQIVYAADHHAGVYLSTNGGASWGPINDGLTMKAVTALGIASGGQVVYAATWGGGVFRLGDVEIHTAYLPMVVRDT